VGDDFQHITLMSLDLLWNGGGLIVQDPEPLDHRGG
jgi:hypothetical protein